MKTKLIFGITLVSCFLLNSCASVTSIKHVNSEKFLKKAELMNGWNSAEGSVLIGTTRERVYLEYQTGITFFTKSPATTVYWTELDNLPDDIVEKIKVGMSPWVSFDCKNNK